MLLIPDFTDAL